jgi:hypothetical protein
MYPGRRKFVKQTGGLIGLLLAAGFVRAEEWNRIAFEGKQLDDVIRGLGGNGAQESAEVVILAPEIAENGAVVPMQIISKVNKTESIAIVVEKNPNPLAAHSGWHLAGYSDAREDGADLQRVRIGTCWRQILLQRQGNQDHARRVRRLDSSCVYRRQANLPILCAVPLILN